MTKPAARNASFVVRWFLALHATVPAAVLVAVLVHLWPPAGLPPLAQRPVWAVWTLIGTWLLASLLAAWALRHLALWRGSLCAAGALLGLAGAAGRVLGAPLQWPMLTSLVALGVVLAGLAAFIGPARVQANRRRDSGGKSTHHNHHHRRATRWRWLAMPSTQGLSFWLAGLLAIESFRIAHIVAAEPARSAGMLGLLVAFFLVLPAATLQAWWPRAAAVLAALAAAALAGLAWRAGTVVEWATAVWATAAALCLGMAIAVLRRQWKHRTRSMHNTPPAQRAESAA
jgi:hypothetical protein